MNNKIKKILFSVPNLQRGGAERFLCNLYNDFELCGWQKKLVLGKVEGGFLKDIKSPDSVCELGALNTRVALLKAIKLIRKEKPDAVICTLGFVFLFSMVKTIPFLPRFKLISRIGNTISSDQLTSKSYFKNKLKLYINYIPFWASDVVIAQSESMKNDFIQLFGEKINHKVQVIHNGVDQIQIKELLDKGTELEVDKDKINFILLGRLFEQKGYDILIEAVSLLDNVVNYRTTFNICGKGPLEIELKKKCKALNVTNVRFIGEVANPYPFIKKHDCLLLPSRYEGFSNTLIEAQFLGLPAIVSDSPGGNREVINDKRLGELFENMNPKDLADKIMFFVNNKNSYNSIEITENASKKYSIESITKHYYELLK